MKAFSRQYQRSKCLYWHSTGRAQTTPLSRQIKIQAALTRWGAGLSCWWLTAVNRRPFVQTLSTNSRQPVFTRFAETRECGPFIQSLCKNNHVQHSFTPGRPDERAKGSICPRTDFSLLKKQASTRQAIYVYSNNEACSGNHCYSGKSNKYNIFSVCVCILAHIFCAVLCCLSGPTIFFHSTHERYNFPQDIMEHKMWILTSSTMFVWNMSHSKKSLARYYHNMYISLQVSTCYSC